MIILGNAALALILKDAVRKRAIGHHALYSTLSRLPDGRRFYAAAV